MAKYLVEAISMFRMRYVIEAKDPVHATDEVVMNHDGNLAEFSQKHLDEVITSVREITDDEYIRQFDEDNDYLKDWDRQQKFKFVNVVDYDK